MRQLGRLLRWLATLASFVAGFMFVGAAHDWLPHWSTLGIFVLILAITAFVIFIHELGHALAYRWQGGVVDEFAVLFLAWRRPLNGGPGGLGWARRMGADIGGYVIGRFAGVAPTRRTLMWVAGAGPLANGILAVLSLLAAAAIYQAAANATPVASPADMHIVAGAPPPGAHHAELPAQANVDELLAQLDWLRALATVQAVLVLIGFNSMITGVLNLIPFPGSDGAAMLRLMLIRRRLRDHS